MSHNLVQSCMTKLLPLWTHLKRNMHNLVVQSCITKLLSLWTHLKRNIAIGFLWIRLPRVIFCQFWPTSRRQRPLVHKSSFFYFDIFKNPGALFVELLQAGSEKGKKIARVYRFYSSFSQVSSTILTSKMKFGVWMGHKGLGVASWFFFLTLYRKLMESFLAYVGRILKWPK